LLKIYGSILPFICGLNGKRGEGGNIRGGEVNISGSGLRGRSFWLNCNDEIEVMGKLKALRALRTFAVIAYVVFNHAWVILRDIGDYVRDNISECRKSLS
jgi:hypothetical protein